MRLAHFIQHGSAAMLRRHFELTGNMVFYQFFKESIIRILQKIIISYAAADKHFFDVWKAAHRTQNIQIFAVICN